MSLSLYDLDSSGTMPASERVYNLRSDMFVHLMPLKELDWRHGVNVPCRC